MICLLWNFGHHWLYFWWKYNDLHITICPSRSIVSRNCYLSILEFHARIDQNSLSTVKHWNSLIPLTSPSLKQPSILKSKIKRSNLTSSTPYHCDSRQSVASNKSACNDSSQQLAAFVSTSKRNSGELSDSVDYTTLESPQLFRLCKNDSLPFSPSQVTSVIYVVLFVEFYLNICDIYVIQRRGYSHKISLNYCYH